MPEATATPARAARYAPSGASGEAVDLLFGVGAMLAVGCGLRAVIGIVATRDRKRTRLHDPNQARCGAVICGSGALLGLLLIAASRMGLLRVRLTLVVS